LSYYSRDGFGSGDRGYRGRELESASRAACSCLAARFLGRVVRPLAPLDDRRGRDRQRHLGHGRLEDALRPDEWNPRAVEEETLAQDVARKDLTVAPRLFFQEVECRRTDAAVPVGGRHGGR